MNIFDMISNFVSETWSDMLRHYDIIGSPMGEYDISDIVLEFFANINSV